ncbi:MAG TPA: hypothetical protein VHB48_10805 [Chitinophagaceae bacterium]|jgi:hypothetical protein|nr:hypothetical protein [Chitinophagaceae bacterium]
MKKRIVIVFTCILLAMAVAQNVSAQCSICTKTASQLGEKPAKALNAGIMYLMLTPVTIAGYIGLRWWKREQAYMLHENQQ